MFNPTAQANEKTMLQQLKHLWKLSSIYRYIGIKQEPRLLCLNAFLVHLIPTIRSYVKSNKTTLSVILGGCIRYIQPLDVALNKPLKALIKEEHDDHYDQHIKEQEKGVFFVGKWRVLLAYQVAKA